MTTTTRTYTRNAAVARKIQSRSVMNRAWEICRNAHNAHNADWKKVVDHGVSLKMSDFFPMAIRIAWLEEKSGEVIYEKVGKLPKKSMKRIHAELADKHAAIQVSIANGFMDANIDAKLVLGNTALVARYGQSRVTDEMTAELREYVLQVNVENAKVA